jgi:hypothetical protein
LHASNVKDNELTPKIMHAAINDGGVTLINRKMLTLELVFASRRQWSNPPLPLPLFTVLWMTVTATATADGGHWLRAMAMFALDGRMMIIIYRWGEKCGNIY